MGLLEIFEFMGDLFRSSCSKCFMRCLDIVDVSAAINFLKDQLLYIIHTTYNPYTLTQLSYIIQKISYATSKAVKLFGPAIQAFMRVYLTGVYHS